jgi:hypothetical protein
VFPFSKKDVTVGASLVSFCPNVAPFDEELLTVRAKVVTGKAGFVIA